MNRSTAGALRKAFDDLNDKLPGHQLFLGVAVQVGGMDQFVGQVVEVSGPEVGDIADARGPVRSGFGPGGAKVVLEASPEDPLESLSFGG